MFLGSVHYFRTWKPWKCILFSDLKTLEAYTIFESEKPGSVYCFRIWKPWKCMLFSHLKTLEVHTILALKTLEVYTILGPENPGSVYDFRIWTPWKCILFSDLKTLEVYTIFGCGDPGSAYYFRIWKPWKCILFSDLKTLEVYTIFGSENPGGLMFDAILSGGPGGREVFFLASWVFLASLQGAPVEFFPGHLIYLLVCSRPVGFFLAIISHMCVTVPCTATRFDLFICLFPASWVFSRPLYVYIYIYVYV